jgi:hypothetical protein
MIALALAAALVAACGGGSATPSVSSAPDGAATCANAATLKTAVQALDAIDVMTVSNTDMKAAIDAVASATDQLIASAQKSIAQELDDLEGAVNVLEAAYEEASSGTIAQSAVPIKAAIADVDTSAIAVDASLKSSCP